MLGQTTSVLRSGWGVAAGLALVAVGLGAAAAGRPGLGIAAVCAVLAAVAQATIP